MFARLQIIESVRDANNDEHTLCMILHILPG